MAPSLPEAPSKASQENASPRTTHLPSASRSHATHAAYPPTTKNLPAETDDATTTSNKPNSAPASRELGNDSKSSSTKHQTDDEGFEMVQSEDVSSPNGSLVMPNPALPDPDKLMDALDSAFKPTIPRSTIFEDSESEDEKEESGKQAGGLIKALFGVGAKKGGAEKGSRDSKK